jgi:hypothetical protein
MQSVKKKVDGGKDSGNLSLSNQSTDRSNDMKPTAKQLIWLEIAAKFGPGCAKKPAEMLTVGDNTYSVEYFVTNRKCYDNLPTPTAMYKINGKRVSRKVFIADAA